MQFVRVMSWGERDDAVCVCGRERSEIAEKWVGGECATCLV